MNHSRIKASVAALAVAALVGLSACGGGSDGLSKADEEALQAELAAAEEAKRQAEEAQRQAELEQARAEAAAEEARRQRQAEEQARQEAEQQRRAEEEARQAAEAEQKRLEEEAEAARQKAIQIEASVALAGLSGTALGAPSSVTPRYRAPATVTATGVSFPPGRGSASGDWYITSLSNNGAVHDDLMTIYSDVRAPTLEDIQTQYASVITALTRQDGTPTGQISIAISAQDHKEEVRSSAWGRSTGTRDYPVTHDTNADDTKDQARFTGSFDGASGTFYCDGTGASGVCTVQYTGVNYILGGSGTWTFRTSSNAKVRVDDSSFMHFGWWRRKVDATGAFSYVAFSDVGTEVSGAGFTALEGSAIYSGPAIGQYAIYQTLGTQSDHGSFTATARLTANFDTDRLSGTVTGFSNNPGWSLSLNETAMTAGTVTDGNVSWTIDGNPQDGGTWTGEFHSEVTPYVDTQPDGIAGTFTAQYGTVGRITGAYGAHKQ